MIQQPLSFLRFKRQPPVPKEATPSNRIDMFFSPTEGKFKATDEAGNAVTFDSGGDVLTGSNGGNGEADTGKSVIFNESGGHKAAYFIATTPESTDSASNLGLRSLIFFQGDLTNDFENALQGRISCDTLTDTRDWEFPNLSGTVALLTGAQTFTGKTIALGSNTISGTLSQFNAACTNADFASLAGAETLSNKTLTNAVSIACAGTVTGLRLPLTYVVANDVTNATTSMTNVTGLAFPVLENKKYAVVMHLATNKNDASGIRLQLTGPSSPTMVDGSAAGTTVDDNTFVTLSFLAFASETATFNTVSGNGRVRAGTMLIANGANAGTVQLQFRSVTGGTSTIRAGSWIQVTQLD